VKETVRGLDRERIAELRERDSFPWIDVTLSETSPDELRDVLDIPEAALEPLLRFGSEVLSARKFYADGKRVAFAFACYVESPDAAPFRLSPVEAHVLVSGDYVLTLHEEHVFLPDLLVGYELAGRSEQYVVYGIIESMLLSTFDALNELELALDDLAVTATDLHAARERMQTVRDVSSRLSRMRRAAGPQRGLFERVGVELSRVESLESDAHDDYFDRLTGQVNRLVSAIDAAVQGIGTLIDVRLNETTYWLTVVATIFLPLTFITGFFGMNFGWMVRHVDTALAFWALGGGSLAVGVALIYVLVIRGSRRPS